MSTLNPTAPTAATPLTDAVLGAIAGGFAVWTFDKLDWFMYRHEDPVVRQRTTAARPGGEEPAHVVVTKISSALGRDLEAHKDRLGRYVHYSLGIVPGAIYGLLHDRAPAIRAGRGAGFGLALFVVEDEVLNPLLGLAGKPQAYPWQAHARGLISHLVFGVVTDAAFKGLKRMSRRRSHQTSAPAR